MVLRAYIASDPSDTGVLAAVQPGATPVSAVTYSVSADPATVLGQATQLDNCFDNGVAVYPGGTEFVLCDNTYGTSTMRLEPGGGAVDTYVAATR